MASKTQNQIIIEALNLLVKHCPRLPAMCYWAGSAALSIEEIQHRDSFDLDFHTFKALADVRPLLAQINKAFPNAFEIIKAPDAFGSGFSGVLRLPDGEMITLEVLANFEDVPPGDLVKSSTAPKLKRVSVKRYLDDKIQCVAERVEARDLVDILAVLKKFPRFKAHARKALAEQDALIITERLLAWTNSEIQKDLEAYSDVNPTDASEARDLLLQWLQEMASEEPLK